MKPFAVFFIFLLGIRALKAMELPEPLDFGKPHPLVTEYKQPTGLQKWNKDLASGATKITFPVKLQEQDAVRALEFRHLLQQSNPFALDSSADFDQQHQPEHLEKIKTTITEDLVVYVILTTPTQKYVIGHVAIENPLPKYKDRVAHAKKKTSFDLKLFPLARYLGGLQADMLACAETMAAAKNFSILSTTVLASNGGYIKWLERCGYRKKRDTVEKIYHSTIAFCPGLTYCVLKKELTQDNQTPSLSLSLSPLTPSVSLSSRVASTPSVSRSSSVSQQPGAVICAPMPTLVLHRTFNFSTQKETPE